MSEIHGFFAIPKSARAEISEPIPPVSALNKYIPSRVRINCKTPIIVLPDWVQLLAATIREFTDLLQDGNNGTGAKIPQLSEKPTLAESH
jgi:hypothetical protein